MTVDPAALASALQPWLDACRWYSGGQARVECALALRGGWDGTVLWLVLATDSARHNVPVTLADRGETGAAPAIAAVDGRRVGDAAEDPAGQRAILALACGTEPVEIVDLLGDARRGNSEKVGAARATLVSAPVPGTAASLAPIANAAKLTSEQSNTSIVYALEDSTRLIAKVFRVLAPGSNPDVHLQRVLSDTGAVPRAYGSARLILPEGPADVVVAQEFLTGAKDAWQVLTADLADSDGGLGHSHEQIRRLGGLTRRIHEALAERCPTVEADASARRSIRAAWSRRAEEAFVAAATLAEWKDRIEEAFALTETVAWPALQRIHGDYHLGQVLDVPGRGWLALDFEGEPLRSLDERNSPDLALRDVAGMLRSFGYAAGAARLSGADPAAMDRWERSAIRAFLEGYGRISEKEQVLLHALVLDKALYELSYEAAQRPGWIPIPLSGIARILGIERNLFANNTSPLPKTHGRVNT